MTYRAAAGRAATVWAATGRAATVWETAGVRARVRMTSWMVLIAVRVFTWAGRAGPFRPAITRTASRVQASTTHADVSHVRIGLSLSFQGCQRRTRGRPGRRRARNRSGKESDLSGGYLGQVGPPDTRA